MYDTFISTEETEIPVSSSTAATPQFTTSSTINTRPTNLNRNRASSLREPKRDVEIPKINQSRSIVIERDISEEL